MTKNERYQHNKDLLPCLEDYICGQDDPTVAELRYGTANRPVRQVGCAAVAVYNALRLVGKQMNFCEILAQFETLRMPWLFGLFGTKPLSLKRFFRYNKIPFQNYYRLKQFRTAFTDGCVGIVSAWNKGFHGIHFYCIFQKDGKLYSLNQYYSRHALDFSIKELSKPRFIVGTILKESAG